jgi:hypothetical protein
VAAYMLAVMGGNENPTADDIKMIIGSVGIESEDVKLNLVIKKLHGKNIEELVAESMYNLNSLGFFCFVFAFVFVFFLLMCNFWLATLNQALSKIYICFYIICTLTFLFVEYGS